MITLKVNGKEYGVEASPETPLLWVIREKLGLTGTKYGCGRSLCGACTAHINGEAVRSCVTPVSSATGKEITTIEGLSADGSHPVQLAWIAGDVPQCGYCHSGQIMSAAALLMKNPNPSDDDIDDFMSGNLCRCGTYQRIRRAVHRAADIMARERTAKSDTGQGRREPVGAAIPVGGGLVVGFTFGFPGTAPYLAAGDALRTFALNPFVRIGPDGIITIVVNKSEMGQGVFTALPMLIAEELECDWSKVRVEPAPVDSAYNNPLIGLQMTGGSMSVRTEWERMRRVGAAAREMLVAAAADIWKVDKAACRAGNGEVIHTSGQRLSYGELAEKAAAVPVPEEIPLKNPGEFTIIGKPLPRLDTGVKVDGRATFGCDVNLPGMLFAVVARPPVFGGTVKSFDAGKAKAQPGVVDVVRLDSGVAVVADGFWPAKRGRDALRIEWDEGPLARLSTDELLREYAKLADAPGVTARKDGDPDRALQSASKTISAGYDVPYLAHANMEPLNCVVDLHSDSCEIWTGTQGQTLHRRDAARVLGLRPEQVTLHTTYLGGGFGRRGTPHSDFVVMAAEVAKAVRKPVSVIWTREDDTKGGWYRPLWYSRFSGGLDDAGKPVAWSHRIVGQSIMTGTLYEQMRVKDGVDITSVEGAANMPYEIPNIIVGLLSPRVGVTVQWWRSVGHSHTGFVVESFIDEMAHAAGADPYEFRRSLLAGHPRHRGVLDLAAEKAGWGKPLPPGEGRGIAVCESYGSFVSEVAEVAVSPEGRVKVRRVVCAVDCGHAVNPSIIEAQMESGIVFGLSAALHGRISIKNGRVEQENFDTYPILRMREMPSVEVHIVPSTENPGGVGEPGTPPIAAAVTNAIFAATGKRVRSLPVAADSLRD